MTRAAAPAPSQRMLRVGELVRHALADALARGEAVDPGLKGRVVTVPEVRMSPDLKLATAYVMPLGGVGEEEVLAALARQAKPLRGAIGRRLNGMRSIPELRFRRDERFDEASRIDALLRDPKVARDLGTGAGEAPGEGEP